MSTTTQFQQLVKPGYGDAADIAVLDTNLDKIDKIGTVLCTLATRPTTNLFNGLRIYETDTKLSYVYTGGAWKGLPQGIIAYTLGPGAQTDCTTGTAFCGTGWTCQVGRIYKATATVQGNQITANGTTSMQFQGAGQNVPVGPGQFLNAVTNTGTQTNTIGTQLQTCSVAGAGFLQINIATSSGAMRIPANQVVLIIEDLGTL